MKQAFFKSVKGGYDRNFTYLIGCPETKQLALIDCAASTDQLESALKEALKEDYKQVNKVFLTHAHHDHVTSLKQIYEKFSPEVYAHELELERVKRLTGVQISHFIQNEEILNLGNEKLRAIHTPGHQASCISFVWQNKIFTGDTLFVEGCGRCDFPESNLESQLNSLRFMANDLPDEFEVYPGHDYGSIPISTIGREKTVNKYLIGLTNERFNETVKENWIAMRSGKFKNDLR